MMTSNSHMDCLRAVADEDIRHLEEKEKTYGGSWKKRGGMGAFMMAARKWDRLENMLPVDNYDVFTAIQRQPGGEDGTVLAEVRDLRRYLLLIESEMVARGEVVYPPARARTITRKTDGKQIEITENGTYQAPCLQALSVNEPNRPGTPDDGGHHATMKL